MDEKTTTIILPILGIIVFLALPFLQYYGRHLLKSVAPVIHALIFCIFIFGFLFCMVCLINIYIQTQVFYLYIAVGTFIICIVLFLILFKTGLYKRFSEFTIEKKEIGNQIPQRITLSINNKEKLDKLIQEGEQHNNRMLQPGFDCSKRAGWIRKWKDEINKFIGDEVPSCNNFIKSTRSDLIINKKTEYPNFNDEEIELRFTVDNMLNKLRQIRSRK